MAQDSTARETRARPRTTRPAPNEPPASLADRRNVATARRDDRLMVLGAVVAAVGLTSVLFGQLLPFDGALGFAVMAYVLFLVLYAVLLSLNETGPAVRDRLAAAVMHSLAALTLLALVTVVGYTFWRGRSALSHLNFYTEDMADAGPLEPLKVGGSLHAVVGTLEQTAIALAITIPLGLVCAVFMSEIPGPFSRFTRIVVEAMTALPSIVAGLFVFAIILYFLRRAERIGDETPLLQKSGLAAAIAISVMMLPIIIRAADVVLRLVPGTLREASYALGASQWRTVWHVVLPTARSGLTTAVILGTARGVGETSPVLLTAGFTAYLETNPTVGPQVSLPLFTFNSVARPEATMIARGFGAAALLMALVLILFVLARIVGGRPAGQLSRGQLRRRAIGSRRDANRFVSRHRGGS